MHSITPHIHASKDPIKSVVHDIDCGSEHGIGWLEKIFSQDLGEGHLEHFVVPQELKIDSNSAASSIEFNFLSHSADISTEQQNITAFGPNIRRALTQRKAQPNCPLRAPPSQA